MYISVLMVHQTRYDVGVHAVMKPLMHYELCVGMQGRSLPLINTEAGGLGGAAIIHQKYELVTQILVLNNSDQTVKYEEQYSIM